jgi:hypothetical protein
MHNINLTLLCLRNNNVYFISEDFLNSLDGKIKILYLYHILCRSSVTIYFPVEFPVLSNIFLGSTMQVTNGFRRTIRHKDHVILF